MTQHDPERERPALELITLGFKLSNGAKHVEKQSTCGIGGINRLIENVEVDSLAC